MTARALPHLEEDERLLPMLVNLSKRYLGSDYSIKKSNVGQVTADMIDMVNLVNRIRIVADSVTCFLCSSLIL